MNYKWTRAISYTVAACVVVGSLALTTDAKSKTDKEKTTTVAAVTSGISSVSGTEESVGSVTSSAFAGVNLTVNNMLANASLLASEVVVADNSAEEVAQSEYSNIAIAQVDNYVYIRSEASAESEYVGKLYNNSAATVKETVEAEDGTWLCITSGDCTGYVKSEYVVQNNEELAKQVSRRLATCMTETLYVREEPTTEASIIDMIPLGDDYTVIDESTADQGWVKITCDAGEGYVSTDYVTLSIEFTLAESKEAEEARLAKEKAAKEAAQAAAKKAAAAAKASSAGKSNDSGNGGKSYSAPSGSSGSSVVNYGAQFIGNAYVYGGSSLTNGTDCSGFVMSCYNAFGVSLPHSSSAMRSVGYSVPAGDMQPGDIVCYSGHVGIYAGNGTLLHASNKSTGITTSNVNYKPIITVRRIF